MVLYESNPSGGLPHNDLFILISHDILAFVSDTGSTSIPMRSGCLQRSCLNQGLGYARIPINIHVAHPMPNSKQQHRIYISRQGTL